MFIISPTVCLNSRGMLRVGNLYYYCYYVVEVMNNMFDYVQILDSYICSLSVSESIKILVLLCVK